MRKSVSSVTVFIGECRIKVLTKTQSVIAQSSGEAECWGYDGKGVVSDTPTNGIFTSLQGSNWSICGLLDSGNIICWGDSDNGGNCGSVSVNNVVAIFSNVAAFVALSEFSVVLLVFVDADTLV